MQTRGPRCPQNDHPAGRDRPHASPPGFLSKCVFLEVLSLSAEGMELPAGSLTYLSDSHSIMQNLEIMHVGILCT